MESRRRQCTVVARAPDALCLCLEPATYHTHSLAGCLAPALKPSFLLAFSLSQAFSRSLCAAWKLSSVFLPPLLLPLCFLLLFDARETSSTSSFPLAAPSSAGGWRAHGAKYPFGWPRGPPLILHLQWLSTLHSLLHAPLHPPPAGKLTKKKKGRCKQAAQPVKQKRGGKAFEQGREHMHS